MEEEKDKRIDEMYSGWKRFWDFWYQHPTLEMNEAFTVYYMKLKEEKKKEDLKNLEIKVEESIINNQ